MEHSSLPQSSGDEIETSHHHHTELSFRDMIQHLEADGKIKSQSQAKKMTDPLHLAMKIDNINVSYSTTTTAVTEKIKEPEVEFDKNSIPIKTMLKAHDVEKKAYRYKTG